MDGLSGVVVVTGAGGDIGRATATLLAARGARILAVDLAGDAAEATASVIRDAGGHATAMVADVTDPAQVRAYALRAAELGPITGFFNNAGVEGRVAPLGEMTVESFDAVFAVNVRGVFLGLSALLPVLESGGAVVNTASSGGLRGSPGMSAYVASKHSVVGLTKVAALESAARGIRVNAVCPSGVDGRMMDSLDAQRAAAGVRPVEAERMGRRATPQDVAGAVAYLLGPDSGFVNGTMLSVDGGKTAG
ncbi:SDR family oxidoreductase [Pseudonocardia halophobica]|uniref:Short chain dehydrogenase n=1 Tax=Pseudonocardia halophobica TaxID=29401 RepID=A0A9W6UFZ5_9PSEU|nr:SDR family NAD(P)-dependent oxidoreductase [Pseudonocardia halophobica]GLL15848.1 short chain dehydrogenase [Pseudonocardia halophobica]